MTKMNKYCPQVNCVEHLNDEAKKRSEEIYSLILIRPHRENLRRVCFVGANIDSLFDAHL